MTIYFISKRTDPLTLYVGKSMDGISLERSLQNHMKEKSRNPNSKFYQWLDSSCEISSLTTYESNPDTQYAFIRMFIKYGYNVLNKIHK